MNLDFFLNQLKANANAMEIINNQMNDTLQFVEETVNNLEGEKKGIVINFQDGIKEIFEKAKKGDMTYTADVENLKKDLLKFNKNGSESNS